MICQTKLQQIPNISKNLRQQSLCNAFSDPLMDFPGGAIKFASFNATEYVSDVKMGYVLPTSYFGNVFNISAIEVVAVTQGQLAIDVRSYFCVTAYFEILKLQLLFFL